MSFDHSSVYVRLMAGQDLKAVNMIGRTSDPYAIITVERTGNKHKTDVCRNNLNPTWYARCIFSDLNSDDVLRIQILDANHLTQDVSLGEARISVRDAIAHSEFAVNDAVTVNNTRRLISPSDESSYTPSAPPADADAPWMEVGNFTPSASHTHIFLDNLLQRSMSLRYKLSTKGYIHLLVAPTSLPDPEQCVPSKHYKRFQLNKMIDKTEQFGQSGGVMGMLGKIGVGVKHQMDKVPPFHAVVNTLQPVHDVFREHSTYKISMQDVDQIFHGRRHGWNRDYVAAQKIFSGPTSAMVKAAVQMQHSYLYGGGSGVKALKELRRGIEQTTGELLDYDDFNTLLNRGMRKGKPRMFTYVLMENKLYLAETGARFFRDMASKHAMHCSAAIEVVYAGELHFRHGQPGSNEPNIRLVVDNNSGTYSPGKEDLPRVAEVFRRNFPGLPVQALDFQDPLLKQYADEVKHALRSEGFDQESQSSGVSISHE